MKPLFLLILNIIKASGLFFSYQDSTDPIAKTHFVAEGEVSFKSILFIPATAPSGMFNDYGGKKADAIKVKKAC